MELFTFIANCPVLLAMFSLMLLACDHRVVNFLHQTVKLTLTATEMLVSELTIFADFLANHILDVSHVPELLVSGKSVSESVPVEEVGDELQPAPKVLVENLVGQVLEVFHGATAFFDRLLEDTVSVEELLVSLFQLHHLFVQRKLIESVTLATTGLIRTKIDSSLPLDVLSHESGHLAFLDHAISVDVELFEEDIELINGH